jgi:hypothetical protein
MQRHAVAYRRHHGIGKRGVVGPAAARPYEDDPRLTYDGAFTREVDANRDLIVIVRRTPAGGEPCCDAMDAGDRRLRLGGLRSRPEGQRDDPDRGKAPPARGNYLQYFPTDFSTPLWNVPSGNLSTSNIPLQR